MVPVRPMFTGAVLHYTNTGQIWIGGPAPITGDELYLSITNEIREAEEQTEGIQVGESWEVIMPTNLVKLQSTIPPVLPDYSS